MKRTTLVIQDEVNCQFTGLDVVTRRKLGDAVKFLLPYARHVVAYKLGRWDGMMRYCDVGGRTYINVLDRLLPIVEKAGYDVVVEDHRQSHHFELDLVDANSYSHFVWPEGHRYAGQPVILLDHQVEAINLYLQNPQSVQSISTGAGKTIITGVLSHRVQQYGRTIIIVPTQDLVTQTEAQYVALGLDVGVFYGRRKEYNRQHTICTWQSLEVLNKKSKEFDPEFDIQAFIDGVVCVMVDEAHSAAADILKKLMTQVFNHIPIRWGMTGTIPREEAQSLGVISTIGPVVNQIKAADLQEIGVLANLHVNVLQLQEVPMQYKSYAEEYKFLTSAASRLQWLARHVSQVAQSGNTLILVNRIETGKELQQLIPDSVFVSGSTKSEDRKAEYREVQTADNKIIIATYGVAAVGIDIPRIFNLYMFEPGKSFIRVIQSIGRSIRRADDKDSAEVYDICGSLKYSKRHLTERKKYYTEAGYPFTIKKVDYRNGDTGL